MELLLENGLLNWNSELVLQKYCRKPISKVYLLEIALVMRSGMICQIKFLLSTKELEGSVCKTSYFANELENPSLSLKNARPLSGL